MRRSLPHIGRQEGLVLVRPGGLGAALAGEMHDRAIAAAHRQRIAGNLFLEADAFGDQTLDAIVPLGVDDGAARMTRTPAGPTSNESVRPSMMAANANTGSDQIGRRR